MKSGQSIRSLPEPSIARIQYDPEWSPSRPFQSYLQGTAIASYTSLDAALTICPPATKWTEWK